MTRFANAMWYVLTKIFSNQKLTGLVLIFCGIASAVIDSEPGVHDASAFICVFLPMGLLLLFSRQDLFDYRDER